MTKGDEIHGMLFFHGGDDSGFVAQKVTANKATKQNRWRDLPNDQIRAPLVC